MINPENVHEIICNHTIGDGEKIVIDFERSEGVHLVDALNHNRYLDCSGQYASMALGWNNPKLKEHFKNDMKSFEFCALHKIANCDFYTSVYAEFVQKFSKITPDFKYLFFIEGGTLGVENAIKAAFDWKAKKLGLTNKACDSIINKFDIIHLKQAFHGRSGYCLSLTNTIQNKVALFPKFNWTRISNPKLNFPIVESKAIIDEELSLLQAEKALQSKNVAAIILETIQGEGGENHFRPEFFKSLRKLADQYETLLILDEVQSGVGLTGKMWAYENFGIIPDMIAFGKKTQVCGFASTTRIDEVKDNVFHESSRISSTWGGNIMDMCRFNKIIDVIKEDNLVDNAKNVGSYFLSELKNVSNIENIRGIGLMIAFDLASSEERDTILKRLNKNTSILPCGEKSIRLRPHLIFSKDNVDEFIGYIKDSFLLGTV